MRRYGFPIVASAMVLLSVLIALAIGPGESPAERNAAVAYREAFDGAESLTAAQRHAIDAWNTATRFVAPGVDAVTWSETVDHILEPVRRAALSEHCDWPDAAADPLTPANDDASTVRLITKLAVWRAGLHFDRGDTLAAIDLLCDAMVLNRHLAAVGSPVTQMVHVADQRLLYEQFAARLPQLDDTALMHLRGRLIAMPYAPMTHAAMRAEAGKVFPWLTRDFARDPEAWAHRLLAASPTEVLAMLPGDAQSNAPTQGALVQAMARLAREAPRTFERYCDEASRLPETFEHALAMGGGGDPIDAITEGIDPQNIVAQWLVLRLFDAYTSARRAELTALAYEALFMAGLDRVQSGTNQTQLAADPFGNGPFAIRATATGFELASEWRQAGQQVVLHFGPRG